MIVQDLGAAWFCRPRMLIRILFPSRVARVFLAGSCVYFLWFLCVVELMLICALRFTCGGVAAAVRYVCVVAVVRSEACN